jgi:hypothetical protein
MFRPHPSLSQYILLVFHSSLVYKIINKHALFKFYGVNKHGHEKLRWIFIPTHLMNIISFVLTIQQQNMLVSN